MTINTAILVAAAALTSVVGDTQTVTEGEIRRCVERAVLQRLQAVGSGARIDSIDGVRAQSLPPGEVRIDAGAIAGRWPRSRVGVPVRLSVDGRLVRVTTVWIGLRDERSVLTYVESIPGKHAASDVRLTLREVDMLCCEGEVLADQEALSELRTRRAVRAGQPAMRSDFEPMPDVLARSRIGIVVTHGAVRISSTGTALADARIGERVAIRPDRSDAPVVGRVTAKQQVMIDAQTH
jgi:flagellar basal body P-ring formation protein FlgA